MCICQLNVSFPELAEVTSDTTTGGLFSFCKHVQNQTGGKRMSYFASFIQTSRTHHL